MMGLMRRSFVLSCGVAAASLLLAPQAGAANFTIVSGPPVTTTQILDTPGDVGTVEVGGIINVPAGNGIQATVAGVTVKNAGSVTGSGPSNAAIKVLSNSTITNSGTATGGAAGIYAVGDTNSISNSGTATGGAYGILAVGDTNSISNSGTATGSGIGIDALGDTNRISNSGTTTGGAYGIFALGDTNSISNSGTATGSLNAIYALGDANSISNSGTATGGSYGILAFGDTNSISNSGTAIGGTASIQLSGTNNTLNLLAGSNLQGYLGLGNATNQLIIGPGLNTALAYTGGTFVDSGLPYILSGGKVYAVDVTGFSVQDEMANDLTRAVTGAVDGRLAASRGAGKGLSTAMNGTVVHAAADMPAGPDSGFWLSGLGSFRDQQASSQTIDFNSRLGGFVLGGDGMITENTRAGLFAGLSFADLKTGGNGQDLTSDSFFGGAYLGHDMGQSFINASLTAGWTGFDSERHIANNQVIGGIETATADYGGLLLSPSLTLGHSMAMQGGTLTPSLRLRYAGLFLDGYDETGSSANLSVDARAFHILDARAELAFALNPHETETGVLSSTLRIGVDGTLTSGGDVSATLLAQTLNFNAANSDTLRVFAGVDAAYAMGHNTSLTLSAEAGYDTSEAFTGQATAGLAWNF